MPRRRRTDYGIPPAFLSDVDTRNTIGDEVADLAALAGFPPDPEQRRCLDAMFAYDRQSVSQAFEVAIIGPRQNIKTGLFKIATLGWMFLEQHPLIVWSAHEFATAMEAFLDLEQLITSTPDLDREIAKISRENGNEGFVLRSGTRLKFKARTKGGARGLTGDRVVLDEALYLKPEHMGALLPTLSARPDPQIVYGSSAGVASSAVLRGVRDRGRAGTSPRLFYAEWADPVGPGGCEMDGCDHRLGSKGCALDDRSKIAAANPQAGRRITWDYLAAEREALPPEEFARERLGWWDEPAAADEDISLEAWMLAESDAEPSGDLSFAVDVAPNHAWASIVVCGNGVLELVERKRWTSWLPDRLAELAAKHDVSGFLVDPSGPIGSLLPEFERAGVPITLVDGKDSVRACSAFVSALTEQKLSHRGEQDFVQAVTGASRRAVGDAWKWSRKDSTVDISPLVAATLALWADLNSVGAEIEPEIYFV